MELGKPLAWLRGVGPGAYLVEAPVWLVAEEPEQHQFVLALDEIMRDGWRPEAFPVPADELRRREYAERTVRQRLHQPLFRRQVLAAYRTQCALCRLRHGELLDAAHIKEDSDGGEPVVPNGIAMCAIHHRAFDSFVLGVRPDYVIEVRRDVLSEADGQTLGRRSRASTPRACSCRRGGWRGRTRSWLGETYEGFRAAREELTARLTGALRFPAQSKRDHRFRQR
jgi:putative restriction endonuclease